MTATHVCRLCGTVNIESSTRCLACGHVLRTKTGSTSDSVDQVDSASHRRTVLEEVPHSLAAGDRGQPTAPVDPGGDASVPPAGSDDGAVFTVRLLLPDGDRRTVRVTGARQALGSGLDHLGVPGDPRVAETEAHLFVSNDQLIVEPMPGATGIYRRVRDEERIVEDDVVLMGDVAAKFSRLPPAEPVADEPQVLGGSAASACGRLTFLRRDGSDGPVHDLPAGKTVLGRTDGHINFPQDARLSRRHGRFTASERRVTIEDLGSRNGTYVRVRERTVLSIGDALRIGSAGLQVRGTS